METKELVKMIRDRDPKAVSEIKLRLLDMLKPKETKTENK